MQGGDWVVQSTKHPSDLPFLSLANGEKNTAVACSFNLSRFCPIRCACFAVINNNTYNVLFDTGANAISLPAEIFDSLKSAAHAKGTFAIDLTSLAQEKVTVRVDYNMNDRFNNQILKSHSSTLLIIGITFLKNHVLGFVDDGTSRIMTLDYT